ncbi:MAG: type II toxin-antitoxin system PemK/MazF family toxin [Patescibacteria group bacterium]
MKTYKLYLAEFPYTESSANKIRPVILLTAPVGKYKLVMAAYVTSQINATKLESDLIIERSGRDLLAKSMIRLHKLTNMPLSIVKRELGNLTPEESNQVRLKLRKLFEL